MAIDLTLNGTAMRLEAPASTRLLDVLREQGHCKGVKEGCGEGECGACTVLVDGETACACLLFAGQVAGCDVKTIEGIADHPITEAMVDAAGVQCGFCTPGMVLSAKALLDHNPKPNRNEIQTALAGNLCRCTGYHRIVEAVEQAAQKLPKAKAKRSTRKKARKKA